MVCNFLRVTNDELEEYLNDSSKLDDRLDQEFEMEESNVVDIDKSWEGILFLLTGQNAENLDHPLSKFLFSGQIIDEDQDLGYGPGHYLKPDQVKKINSEIAMLSTEDLKARYDPAKMDSLNIYPTGWTKNGDGLLDYLLEYFETVKQIYSTASAKNEALITFLN